MIKTLHITSIIVAVLAAGLFVFPVVFGFREDKEVEKFLTAPSVLDQFRNNAGNTRVGSDENSPLVAQATSFGLILNPPPKPVVVKRPGATPVTKGPKPPPPPPPTAKFKVVATSYNQSRPEESLALIDEPGKGLHWVRQADIVGHLTIEVQNGVVLAKAGTRTETIAVPHKPYMSLMAGQSEVPFPTETSTPIVTPVLRKGKRGKGSVSRPRAGKTGNTGAGAAVTSTAAEIDPADREMAAKIFAELEAMTMGQPDTTSSAGNDKGGPAAGAEGTGITGTEADNIGNLGRELENSVPSPSDRAKRLKQRRAERSKKLRERIEKSRRTRK